MPDVTPEEVGRAAGQAIADAISDGLEPILLKLADAIDRLSTEQDNQREEIRALANRIEALTREVRG